MDFLTRALLCLILPRATSAGHGLIVDTTSGPVTGFINNDAPQVAQFLGIPFAEQPVGERRWLPPIPKSREASIKATSFGNSCPQYLSNKSTIWTVDAPEFGISPGIGENCLSVNVWTPHRPRDSSKSLPVIAWLYGGGFQTGGGSVPYQNPSHWIQRSRRHIAVSIKLNIFGFPNAAGLRSDQQNLGLLDQRLALEWIRSNIANFGGDPHRITLWGQSAGAVSVDYFNFAYPNDPIVHGLIMDSGSAWLPIITDNPNHTNFTFVAEHFGCGNLTATDEIQCMRKVSSRDIIAFLENRDNSDTMPPLTFYPVVDNRTTFANYTERATSGLFSKKPALIGTTKDEGVAFVLPYDKNGVNMTTANFWTLTYFLCPIVQTTQDRFSAGAPTFRYLYAGNFSNISPQWWEGAYHAAELPLIFGTSGIVRGASTPFEIEVSKKMQDYWLAFAEDPINGLPKMEWDAYWPDGDAVFLGSNGTVAQPIGEKRLEAPCDGVTPRPNATPPP